jgi:anti-sigma regulatory factor (Ser/Thr protein kinase)
MKKVDKRYTVAQGDYFNAGSASSDIKKILRSKQLDKDLIKRVSVAAYEAEINMVIHSLGGHIDFKWIDDAIYLQFLDIGPGIPDIALAMTPGYSTADETSRLNGFGAGMGLTNIQKSADEMTLISDPNGTVLKLLFYVKEASHDPSRID